MSNLILAFVSGAALTLIFISYCSYRRRRRALQLIQKAANLNPRLWWNIHRRLVTGEKVVLLSEDYPELIITHGSTPDLSTIGFTVSGLFSTMFRITSGKYLFFELDDGGALIRVKWRRTLPKTKNICERMREDGSSQWIK